MINLIILFLQCLIYYISAFKNMVLFYHTINEAIKAYIINTAYWTTWNILIISSNIYYIIYSLCKWQSSPSKAWVRSVWIVVDLELI